MKTVFKITGTQKLKAALLDGAKATAIKDAVKKATYDVQRSAQSKTGSTYIKGYSTGATKQGIMAKMEHEGLTGVVGMTKNYNVYTEYGTRFMAAEPVLKPVFNDSKSKFMANIKRLVQ